MSTKPIIALAVGAATVFVGVNLYCYVRAKVDLFVDWHVLLRPSRLTYTTYRAGPFDMVVLSSGNRPIITLMNQYRYGLDVFSQDDLVVYERLNARMHPHRIEWLEAQLEGLTQTHADPDRGTYRFAPQ
jgi:hypothetical protein